MNRGVKPCWPIFLKYLYLYRTVTSLEEKPQDVRSFYNRYHNLTEEMLAPTLRNPTHGKPPIVIGL